MTSEFVAEVETASPTLFKPFFASPKFTRKAPVIFACHLPVSAELFIEPS
jgi:hypothetical protein